MGRRPKKISCDPPPNRTLATIHVLPKANPAPQTIAGNFVLSPASFGGNQFTLSKMPGNSIDISNRVIQDVTAQLHTQQQQKQLIQQQQQSATSPTQKIILPKLPAGVKPPSKIIVINGNETFGQPKIQVSVVD